MSRGGQTKHNIEMVKQLFESRGYTLLETSYINNRTPLRYQCSKHGERRITLDHFKNGHGCAKCGRERRIANEKTHHLSKHPCYSVWKDMIYRCYNPKNQWYHRYGARGITVCDEWRESPIPFCEWAVNSGYKKGVSLDRIDNNGNYSPENCRWVDFEYQSNNTCRNLFITLNGKRQTAGQWDKEFGLKPSTMASRVRHGYYDRRGIDIQASYDLKNE